MTKGLVVSEERCVNVKEVCKFWESLVVVCSEKMCCDLKICREFALWYVVAKR